MPNIDSIVLSDPSYGNLLLTAHNASSQSTEEWVGNYLKYVIAYKGDIPRGRLINLVFAEGPGPNSKQRRIANDIFEGKKYELKVSVVTSSVRVRAVVTALSWLNPHIRAFPAESLPNAVDHIGYPRSLERELLHGMFELTQRVPNVEVLRSALAFIETHGGIFAKSIGA